MSIIARLGVWLGINSSEFKKGLDEAIKKTKEFEANQKAALKNAQKAQDEFMGIAAKGLAGIAAAGLAVGQAFKYADDIEDTAAAFDVTTEALLALKAAMQGAGGEADNIGNALQKLAVSQQDAIDGSDELREAFSKLNISGKDVENLRLQDLFKRVAQELAAVENTTQRAALQQQILGKAMKGIDARTFVDKYKEMGDPNLLAAIKQNAKAWENIESAFKNILLFAQKLVSPLAAIVNSIADIADTMNNLSQGGSAEIDWGASELGGMPGAAITHGYGKAPSKKGQIAAPGIEGAYSTQTDKQKAAAKKSAESKTALNEEISLLKIKADIAQKMFAVDSKGIELGSAAITQEKMMLDLSSDLAAIRSSAAKERKKEGAQIALINTKENAQINLRVAQFGFENGLRIQQIKKQHELTMKAIQDEGMAKYDAMSAEIQNALNVLDIEEDKFKLGFDAYELAKLQNEQNGKLRLIHLQSYEALQKINKEYELSAKSANDLELYEEKLKQLRYDNVRQITYTSTIEEKKQEILKNQLEISKQLFALDIAQQKGRDIANIQAELNVERQRAQLESARYLMSTNQYNLSNLALENINRLIAAEKKYNDQMKEAEYEMQRQGGGQRAREEYEKRIEAIKEVRDIELNAIDQINNARQQNLEKDIERQKSFVAGWQYSAKQFQENSENAFKRGEAAFSSVMSSMDRAISNFSETGKFKFEEFALSIIRDLVRMEMQAQASILFRSIVGFFSPAPIKTMNYDAGIEGVVGKAASGGAINSATLVGENGPELFIPNTPGTVIPNGSWQQMASRSSGMTINGPYIAKLDAIDAKTFEQYVMGSNKAVWAANQYAQKSMATNMGRT